MKKKKKTIIILLLLLLSISIATCLILWHNRDSKRTQDTSEKREIESLKYETGASAKEELYTIQRDVDGRKVLAIKGELKYKVALAGILKQNIPTYEELNHTLEDSQIHAGIWISSESRTRIFSLIKRYLKDEYSLNEQGYLILENKTEHSNGYDKKLQTCLQNGKTYILAMTGQCYNIDNMTGEIMVYPFEDMDPYQLCEPIQYDDKKIVVLSTNKWKKLRQEEILEAMIEQMNME